MKKTLSVLILILLVLTGCSEKEISTNNLMPIFNNTIEIKNCSYISENLFIDTQNTLFFYKIDSTGELHKTKLLDNVISILPKSMDYGSNSVCSILTDDGTAYFLDWQNSDNTVTTAPTPVMAITNLQGMKEVAGNNLFIKEDGSLWNFSNNLDFSSTNSPIDSNELNWVKIYDNVQTAASSSGGNLIFIKTINNELYMVERENDIWGQSTLIAEYADYFMLDFTKHNEGPEHITAIYYTDDEHNLYKVTSNLTEAETIISEAELISTNTTYATVYYDTIFIINDENKAFYSAENEVAEFDFKNSFNILSFSQQHIIENNQRFIIDYVFWHSPENKAVIELRVTDLGEIDEHGIG